MIKGAQPESPEPSFDLYGERWREGDREREGERDGEREGVERERKGVERDREGGRERERE